MSTDLRSAIDTLAEFNHARLAEDEATAQAAGGVTWVLRSHPSEHVIIRDVGGSTVVWDEGEPSDEEAAHIVRHDPASTLRESATMRELIATILKEAHEYIPGDEFYSCSQAVDPYSDDKEPGSGCTDDDRRGDPCDCGRDLRVERLLRIIATRWREHPGYPR